MVKLFYAKIFSGDTDFSGNCLAGFLVFECLYCSSDDYSDGPYFDFHSRNFYDC